MYVHILSIDMYTHLEATERCQAVIMAWSLKTRSKNAHCFCICVHVCASIYIYIYIYI